MIGALLWCLALAGVQAQGPADVVKEWKLDTAEAAALWSANEQVKDWGVVDGALHFRCEGADPILFLKPKFDVPATARQAIEMRLKTDRNGMYELFWSGTSEGKYGGFDGEKCSRFLAKGDGKWHTYRVFPFWQHEGKIVQLRVDPYDAATVDISDIRIVSLPGADVEKPVFDFAKGMADWQGMNHVALARVAGGLRVVQQGADAFCLSPSFKVEAETNPVVSVRIRSEKPTRAALVFATDAAFGLKEHTFDVLGGGKAVTYNLDVLDTPGWMGNIVAIGLRPGPEAGAAFTVERLQIGEKATGSAELRVLSFGVDDALPRAGVPVSVSARVTNMGGGAAKGARARLTVAGGKAVGGGSGTYDLVFGQEEEWSWKVVFAKPGKHSLQLAVGSGGRQVTASAVASVTARLSSTKASYVPKPKPVRPKIDVGVYYFPGWKNPSQWEPILRYPERRPVLGWYAEGSPEVADWHIKFAVEHGITFFAYDWYWSQGARSLEHGLHDGYLKARYRNLLKFCLLWANHNAPGTSSVKDSIEVARFWIDNYFRLPEYYRVDGKPVVIIFAPSRYRDDIGSAETHRAFDAMREECRKAGLPGIYLIACVGGVGDAKACVEDGYDAVTCYNWAGLNMEGSTKWSPYARLIEGYADWWAQLAEQVSLPQMLPISGGWDNRPWAGAAAMVRSNRTPAVFKKHLQDARKFVEAHPDKTIPSVLIEAWNELGEGSYIEPVREFGFGYLDAVRDVFVGPKAHQDGIPADYGLTVPQVERVVRTASSWDFSTGAHGWQSMMGMTTGKLEGGALVAETNSNDPAFTGPPMQLEASRFTKLHLRVRLTALDGAAFSEKAQVFWSTRSGGMGEPTSVRFDAEGDGQWHDYVLDVAANPRWRGLITGLRYDPVNRPGVRVEIAAVRLEAGT